MLILIPDSEDIRAIKQQNQQQVQLCTRKHSICELMLEYITSLPIDYGISKG